MLLERDVLVDIADSIADGKPVDWEREEPPEEIAGKLRWLQVVEAISLAHRGAQDETIDPPEQPIQAASERSELPLRWGPLLLLERVGDGSLGEVHRARDTRLGCDVALKLLKAECSSPRTIERFLDEGRRLARVRHPNVVVVHGADSHDGRPGMWTELLEGQTLEESLAAQGPFGADEAARIGIDLCRALAAVHGAGLVHRDVKTANVMRERGGRIVLLDFSSVCEQTMRAGSRGLFGTPLFMAPELFDGTEADSRSDIYSLGVLLYRLVTGGYPVQATNLEDLEARHRSGETRSLLDARPELPPGFVRIVETALDRDPSRRWASPGEMERALSALAAPQPVTDRRRHRRGTPVVALAVAAAVALAAIVAWLMVPPSLEVETHWFRSGADGVREPLAAGARVSPGDGLSLEIESTRTTYVWVLNQDAHGDPVVVFPIEDLDHGNPLEGGRRHRLPGTAGGQLQVWSVDRAGGIETFLVVTATKPLPEFERRIGSFRQAGLELPADAPSSPRLRGITHIVPSPRKQGAVPGLPALDAWLGTEYGKQIRVLLVHFENPEP